jgi:hypothetical protein
MATDKMARSLVPYLIQVHPGYVNVTYGTGKIGDVTQFAYVFRDEPPPKQGRAFAMPCQPYCGLNLHRFHISCFTCPIRMIRAGRLPLKFPVRAKWLTVHPHDGGLGRVKATLLKPVLSVLSMLGY